MKMKRTGKAFTILTTTLMAGGTCFQFGGCDPLGLAVAAVSSINPCGTILACDPRQYEYATSGIDGPGINPDIDPFCTYPPFCPGDVDPIFGGISPYFP